MPSDFLKHVHKAAQDMAYWPEWKREFAGLPRRVPMPSQYQEYHRKVIEELRQQQCQTCRGSGKTGPKAFAVCPKCNGSGFEPGSWK